VQVISKDDFRVVSPRQRPDLFTQRDARQLLLNFASAAAYGQTVLAAWSTSWPAWTGSPASC
jgi:hypothetical protein